MRAWDCVLSVILLSLVCSLCQASEIESDSPENSMDVKTAVRKKHRTSHVKKVRSEKSLPVPIKSYPEEVLNFWKGEVRLIQQHGKISRVAVGSGDAISTTTVGDNLLVIGETVGETSLFVWTADSLRRYRVRVSAKDRSESRALLDLLLKGYPGVSISEVSGRYIVSGIAHKEALDQLKMATADIPNVLFNVKEDAGLPSTQSVLFRVHFVEVSRSFLEKIGIQWGKDAAGPTIGAMGVAADQGVYRSAGQVKEGDNLLAAQPAFVRYGPAKGGFFLGLATTLTSRLNLGVSDGDVRLLASPELTARSGGKSRLLVGGQIPIPMAGAFGATTVEFKDYGIILTIEPTINSENVITARVGTEVSQIDPSVTIGGIPGFLKRETATEISVKPGEVVALAGLVNSELSTAVDRMPWLSSIPVLGRLFRSDDFRNKRSDLVVLLEPEIIKPGQGLAQDLKAKGESDKQEFERRVRDPKSMTGGSILQ